MNKKDYHRHSAASAYRNLKDLFKDLQNTNRLNEEEKNNFSDALKKVKEYLIETGAIQKLF